MGGIKLKVHPLFLAFGAYYALTGKLFVFLMVTVCAVIHELGHSVVANARGYRLDKITLMPFGACVSGDVDGLKVTDQIKIALAGPLVNLAVGVFFVAGWWVFPKTYAYTDVVVQTCLSLFLVNLIPAYPLDGGRVLFSLLATRLGTSKAERICRVIGVVLGALLLAGFGLTCFRQVNLSLLFFALFVLFGAKSSLNSKYVRGMLCPSTASLKRGVPYKRQAVDSSVKLKTVLTMLDQDCINELVVYVDGKPKTTLSQERLEKILQEYPIYNSLGEILKI